jgi:TRAP-type C4-dicarboxylate transport system permease small subunit
MIKGKLRTQFVPALEKSLVAIDMVALAAIVFISIYGVIARYVFKKPLFWGMELSTSLAVWMTFLISGVNYKRNIHFTVDLLYGSLNKKLRFIDDIIVALVTLFCIGVCLYSAVVSFIKNYKISMAAMEISVSFTLYLPLILGYASYIFFMIYHFFTKEKEIGQEGV